MKEYRRPALPPSSAVSAATTIAKLSESSSPSTTKADSWSVRISNRYGCQLSPDLADWFDSETWRYRGISEYREPVDATVLLEPSPEVIWPGLMPCDLLPILGNTAGDWLCVRVDQRNRAAEVVQWYHGGGDWLPWGRSISDAILFDALSERLPSPARRHATPAENTRQNEPLGEDKLLSWARGHVPAEVAALLDRSANGDEIASTLLDAGVSELAVRCELVQSALKETLSATLDPATAQQLGVDWNDVVQWMFDVQRMPVATRQRLEREYGLQVSKPQDWESAEHHSQRVVEQAPELAWAWDVIGYAAERRGEPDVAANAYQRAAACSVFTDQSVRLRTHWTTDDAAKFSASRLQACFPETVRQSPYLQILCEPDTPQRRSRLTKYWLDRAAASAATGDWNEAHRHYFAAGWDLGAEPLSAYGELLDRIAEAAEHAHQTARAELARTHRRCLKDRYSI